MKSGNLKDKLFGALGTFGIILFYILATAIIGIPLAFLDWPFWVDLIVLLVIYFFNLIGGIVQIIIFALSMPVALSSPINFFTIMYFICLAVYVIFCLIPAIITIVHKD